ncbi:MAG TPA: rhodanese-related sulfurtransferase [Paenalcaligenes sp.]|nr:rhodanese-related sulfurtransferase [Paenalcaligenes sp.]
MSRYLIAALYHFVALEDYKELQAPLYDFCAQHSVVGTLLLAREGINGTIAGPERGVRAVLAYLRSDPNMAQLQHKEAWSDQAPFYRLKVRLKKEIVTLGVPELRTAEWVGEYVPPQSWNELISRPDVVLVDTRNDYEVGIGTFKGAVNPQTDSFADFPQWVQEQQQPGGVLEGKPPVAMFCTGGIRCEKSTAYLRTQGFDEVYHLQGGILQYLEDIPEDQSMWVGECFVFDERVSVGHGLKRGDYEFCRSCRMPVSAQERQMPQFEPGVSCPYCHGTHSPEKIARLRERERQMRIAKQRQIAHVGANLETLKETKRQEHAARVEAQKALHGQAAQRST